MNNMQVLECPNCNTDITVDDFATDDFDAVLISMLGKSYRLTKVEEDIITRIAEKFKFG